MEQTNCLYCGRRYSIIHGTMIEQTPYGDIPRHLVNGQPEGSREATESRTWCGHCDKKFDTDKIKKILEKVK